MFTLRPLVRDWAKTPGAAPLSQVAPAHTRHQPERERSKGKFYGAWLLAALNLHDAIIVITLITAQLKTKIQTNLGIKYHRQVIYVQSVPPLDQNWNSKFLHDQTRQS